MRVTIQRVVSASVKVANETLGSIERGLLVFVGIEDADLIDDVNWMAKKVINLRIFPNNEKPMNSSLLDVDGDLLIISQFTLFASTKKGNRPSFTKSGKPAYAKVVFEQFISELESILGKKVQKGVFGADMQVSLVNDGPVTINIDSRDKQ